MVSSKIYFLLIQVFLTGGISIRFGFVSSLTLFMGIHNLSAKLTLWACVHHWLRGVKKFMCGLALMVFHCYPN